MVSLVEISPVILEMKILKFIQFIFAISLYYLPLENCVAFQFKKLESSSPTDALCQFWFLGRRFLNFVNAMLLFRFFPPPEKGVALHLNKIESRSPKDALCQVWIFTFANCFPYMTLTTKLTFNFALIHLIT